MILLVSASNSLTEPLTAALPEFVSLVHLTTLRDLKAFLQAPTDEVGRVDFILLEAVRPELVGTCRQVCREAGLTDLPVIAIISDPADRQAVLEVGADDYLLQPLIPAETKSRLSGYLRSGLLDFSSLIKSVILQVGTAGSSGRLLDQKIESLAQLFNASAAWLLLLNPGQKSVTLVSSYNLPPLFEESTEALAVATWEWVNALQPEKRTTIPQVRQCPYLTQFAPQETNQLAYHLSIPLHSREQIVGLLNLAYKQEPSSLSRAEKRTLTTLGRNLGMLLEMFTMQEEMQIHATQNAFLVLLARTVSQRLDLHTILSLTLEQAVPLLNASGGEIWLLSPDSQRLDLVSSLSNQMYKTSHQTVHQPSSQGLKGWVIDRQQPLQINVPTDDPRFDPEVDLIVGLPEYALLAMPLRHGSTLIGVLTIYSKGRSPFTARDVELLEGIASLTTSAIVNARLMQELRDHADQQRILYEMGQQIAAGLDLQDTLNRVLRWISRLFETEVGLLWLVEQSSAQQTRQVSSQLRLVAALGIDLPGEEDLVISQDQDIAGWVAQTGETVLSNEPAAHPYFDASLSLELNLTPRNLLAVPMVYHDDTIGTIALLNKIGSSFTEADLTLLSTVVDMVAVAVGNARLHTRTLTLMEEKERLAKQILQSERLATMGRLTASLSHEINNPMQAIQGALTLALEELDNPAEVDMYIRMSLQESDRVVKLINRLRQVYRPQTERPESLDLNRLLQEAVAIARKELKRQKVTLQVELASQLPPLTVIANQIHLVFLSLILNLSDAIGAAGGGPLYIRSYRSTSTIIVKFSTKTSILTLSDWDLLFKTDSAQDEINSSLGLSLSYDIIGSHGATVNLNQTAENVICRLEFPLSPPNLSSDELGL